MNIENIYSVTEDAVMLYDMRYPKQSLLSINHNSKYCLPHGMEICPTYYSNLLSGK